MCCCPASPTKRQRTATAGSTVNVASGSLPVAVLSSDIVCSRPHSCCSIYFLRIDTTAGHVRNSLLLSPSLTVRTSAFCCCPAAVGRVSTAVPLVREDGKGLKLYLHPTGGARLLPSVHTDTLRDRRPRCSVCSWDTAIAHLPRERLRARRAVGRTLQAHRRCAGFLRARMGPGRIAPTRRGRAGLVVVSAVPLQRLLRELGIRAVCVRGGLAARSPCACLLACAHRCSRAGAGSYTVLSGWWRHGATVGGPPHTSSLCVGVPRRRALCGDAWLVAMSLVASAATGTALTPRSH